MFRVIFGFIGWVVDVLLMFCFLLVIFMILSTNALSDNLIAIDQVGGDNLNLEISQFGYLNEVLTEQVTHTDSSGNVWNFSGLLSGDNTTIIIKQNRQYGTEGQAVSIAELEGTGNTVMVGQGYDLDANGTFVEDYDEHGDQFVGIAIDGDYNEVKVSQRTNNNSSGHEAYVMIEGDDNDVHIKQKEGGSQFLEVGIISDDNIASIVQKGHGDHQADILITGQYGTDISLTQSGVTGQSFSIQQNCITVGGCGISVTQN